MVGAENGMCTHNKEKRQSFMLTFVDLAVLQIDWNTVLRYQ